MILEWNSNKISVESAVLVFNNRVDCNIDGLIVERILTVRFYEEEYMIK